MSWNYHDHDKVKGTVSIGEAFKAVCGSVDGMTRSEARRVLRGVWIALGLDEADPFTSPAAVEAVDPTQAGGAGDE